MEAIKRQASRLREQVAKQQQAVLKQLSGRFAIDALALDEPDAECHQQLQMLYKSTREAKHFQRNIMRGLEGLISASSRQMEIASKLADACCKYGENENSDAVLARASLHFGNSHHSMEEEREKLLKILGDQVYEPLRTMIMGAPLEDARHLAHCYEKLRQDVESQAVDVARRQLKSKEAGGAPETPLKLQHSELRLSELGSALAALGREATSAMESVAADQQRITFQQLLAMVDAERGYHHNVASILDELRDAMVLERQKSESERQPASTVGGILALASCEEEHEEEEKLQSDDLHENHTNGVHARERNSKTELNPSNNLRGDHADGIRAQTTSQETEPHQSGDLQGDHDTGIQAEAKNEEIEPNQSRNYLRGSINGIRSEEATDEQIELHQSGCPEPADQNTEYFIAEVIHPFDAQADGELSLSTGDYVVVRQGSENGWLEGECKGKAGWFPAAYAERRDRAPANRVIEPGGGLPPAMPPATSSRG